MKRIISLLLLFLALSSTCLAQDGRTQDAPLDNKRIGFAPTVVRYANLAAQDVTTWSGLPGLATVTTGVKAPDGTTTAAMLLITSPITGGRVVYSAQRALRAGDWLVFGIWVKAVSLNPPGASLDGQAVARVTASDPTIGYRFDIDSLNFRELRASVKADTQWEWVTSAAKVISAPSTPTATVEFELQCAVGRSLAFYAPVLHHLETGEATDAEARALLQNLYSVPDGVPAGNAALLRGQALYCYNAGSYSPCSFGAGLGGDPVIEDATPSLEFRDTDGADFIHEVNAGNYFLRFVGSGTMLFFSQAANKITVQTGVGFRADSVELASSLLDTNLNELLKVTGTGSAVNEFTIANAATGNGPTLSASGDDTNVPINYTTKGAGAHVFNRKATIGITGGSTGTDTGLVIGHPVSNSTGLLIAASATPTLLNTSSGYSIQLQPTGTGLLVVGGSGVNEIWKDSTPSKATAFGMAVPGQSITDDFLISAYDGSSWSERFRIANAAPWAVMPEATSDPGAGLLASGNHVALYRKNDKIVIAYNVSGTIWYMTADLNTTSGTVTWTRSTTAP